MLASACVGLIGLATSVLGSEAMGAWLSVAGFVAMGWALHRFGRSGPDPR